MYAYRTIVFFFLVMGLLGWNPAASMAQSETDAGLREKVYLHLDKALYLPGEIIWLKAYVVDAHTQKPVDISRVAYVEVISPAGERTMQAKIPLGAGQSNSGSLYVPPDMSSGRYRVVAYTALMENYGPASFFETYIDILNPLQETALPTMEKLPAVLCLFPESGQLLDGVGTQMGVKLVGENGAGQAFQATVYEQDTIEVARIRSNRWGMGRFSFTPRKGAQYTVRLAAGEAAMPVSFPEVEADGYQFNVERIAGTGFRVRVSATAQHTNENLTLRATNHAGSQQGWPVRLSAQAHAALDIGLDELPDGLLCLTLFDPAGRPVAERLVFKPGTPQLEVNATVSQPTAAHRSQVAVSVQAMAPHAADWPDLSVSVFKVDDLQQVPNSHIGAYLHLQSAVKGYIEDMGYYFSSDSEEVQDDLDVLLLTQAWRKISPVSATPNIAEYKSHELSIRFSDSATGRPIANEMAFLSVPSTDGATYTAVTGPDGVASFSVRNLYGNKQIIAQLATTALGDYDATVVSPYADGHEWAALPAGLPADYTLSDLQARSVDAQATHLYQRRERGRYRPVDEALFPFFGSGDVTYWLDDYTRFVLMEEVLREYVTEVSVRRSRADYSLRVLDADNNVYFDGQPLLLLDGIPLVRANEIIDYDPLQVEKIDVVTGKYYYGTGVYDGIVSFSTYDGHIEGFELDSRAKVFHYEGMQYEREFYVPPYADGQASNPRVPDFRNVLHWEPRLAFDETGTATLRVSTSDLSGRFAVLVQGIDQQGRTAYHLGYFDVP